MLENIHPWTGVIEHVDLTSSFALLPQAGGAGRDGIAHKEAWDKVTFSFQIFEDALHQGIKIWHKMIFYTTIFGYSLT